MPISSLHACLQPDERRSSLGRRGRRLGAWLAGLALALAVSAPAASGQIALVPFGGQSYDSPFHVAAPPGDASRVFVVEEGGTIRLVKDGVTQPTPFLSINGAVMQRSEGGPGCECGMFSMAFAPDYATSGLFYVFYTRDDPTAGNRHYLRIEEFRRAAGNPDTADPATRRIVLEIPHLTAENHNGGQLQFGPDRLLYIWTGDGGDTPTAAQSLSSRLGKVLRIDPRGSGHFQYSIPVGNPFADGAGPNADEIYAYGLRNPYRGSFDRSTGDFTTGDVGRVAVEEIDWKPEGGASGANFGWPCFEGFGTGPVACSAPNHSPPVHQYPHGGGGAAVNGGFVIRDSALPSLAGRYVYADTFNALGNQLRTLVPSVGSASDAPLGVSVSGVVSFGQDACGHIYVATLGGQVLRLQPTSGDFPCKLAPELKLKTKKARRAARKGAIIFRASCDEDCDVSADGVVKIAGRKRKLKADADGGRVQIGEQLRLKLDLSRRETRRLRRALDRGAKAKAKIVASATGGGGGTDTERRKVKQRRPKGKR